MPELWRRERHPYEPGFLKWERTGRWDALVMPLRKDERACRRADNWMGVKDGHRPGNRDAPGHPANDYGRRRAEYPLE